MSTPSTRRKLKFGSYSGAPPSVDKLPVGTESEIMVQVWKRIGALDSRITSLGGSTTSSTSSGLTLEQIFTAAVTSPDGSGNWELVFDGNGDIVWVA